MGDGAETSYGPVSKHSSILPYGCLLEVTGKIMEDDCGSAMPVLDHSLLLNFDPNSFLSGCPVRILYRLELYSSAFTSDSGNMVV